MPKKRVLSVGITNYQEEPLKGCINDVKLGVKVWRDVYGFDEVKILTNEQATKINILKGLDWLISDHDPGSWLLFHYSGHMSSVPCTTETATSEIDRMDEVLVTYDFDWEDPIRDDYLAAKFGHIDNNSKVIVCLDACQSGTALKGCLPHKAKNKYIDPPPSIMLESGEIDIDLDSLTYNISRDSIERKTKQHPFLVSTMDQGRAILLSACRDHEYAADAFIPGPNRHHGVFTFFMMSSLREKNWNMTYRELATVVNEKLDEAEFVRQTPQLECYGCFDDLFLGGK